MVIEVSVSTTVPKNSSTTLQYNGSTRRCNKKEAIYANIDGEEVSDDEDSSDVDDVANSKNTWEIDNNVSAKGGVNTRVVPKPAVRQSSSTSEQIIQLKKVNGVPTAFTAMNQLKSKKGKDKSDKIDPRKSSDTLNSGDSELELYEQEPGSKHPKRKPGSTDTKSSKLNREDEEVAKINRSAIDSNKNGKKNKKKPASQITIGDLTSGKVRTDKIDVKVSKNFGHPVLSLDVWEEAISGSPLASSETIEKAGLFDPSRMQFEAATTKYMAENDDSRKSKNLLHELKVKLNNRPVTPDDNLQDESMDQEYNQPVVGRRQQRHEKSGDPKRLKSTKDDGSRDRHEHVTNMDDLDDNTEKPVGRTRKVKQGKGHTKPATKFGGIIHIESGSEKAVFVDSYNYQNDADRLAESLLLNRDKMEDFVTHLRSDYDSECYDEDLNMIPASTFQIPDIVPLSNFSKRMGVMKPPKATKPAHLEKTARDSSKRLPNSASATPATKLNRVDNTSPNHLSPHTGASGRAEIVEMSQGKPKKGNGQNPNSVKGFAGRKGRKYSYIGINLYNFMY